MIALLAFLPDWIRKLFILPKKPLTNFEILQYVLLLFVGWRMLLFFITFIAISTLPTQNFYEKILFFVDDSVNYWGRWANWDSGAFMSIARDEYTPMATVFLPGYPLAIKLFTILGLNTFWAGFLVSQIAAVAALFFLYKLIIIDHLPETAKKAVFALLIYPSSFYLAAVYSESLFLAVTLAAFYFARKNNWLLAFLLAGLSACTRLVGLGVVAALIIEFLMISPPPIKFRFFIDHLLGRIFLYLLISWIILGTLNVISTNNSFSITSGVIVNLIEFLKISLFVLLIGFALFAGKKLLPLLNLKRVFSYQIFYLLLGFLPFAGYLLYLKFKFDNALIFLEKESSWGRGLTNPLNAPFFNLEYLSHHLFEIGSLSAHMHVRLLIFALLIVFLVYSLKKLRLSYSIFFITCLLTPLMSGTLADITRYSLVIFPVFILIGLVKNELLEKIWFLGSSMLLTLLLVLYFNNYFFI